MAILLFSNGLASSPSSAQTDSGGSESLKARFQGFFSKTSDAEVHLLRGNKKFELKQYRAAIADYDIALTLTLEPEKARLYLIRGFAKYNLGPHHYAAAIADYTEAITREPENVDAHILRSRARADMGWIVDANKDLRKAIRLLSKDPGVVKVASGQSDAPVTDSGEAPQS